jgi:hypothetical protein
MKGVASIAEYGCDSSAVQLCESQTRHDCCGTQSICAADFTKTLQVKYFIQSRLMSSGPVPVDFDREHTRQVFLRGRPNAFSNFKKGVEAGGDSLLLA